MGITTVSFSEALGLWEASFLPDPTAKFTSEGCEDGRRRWHTPDEDSVAAGHRTLAMAQTWLLSQQ